MILIMECNVRPKFKSAPGDAEEERVIDALFPNRFTSIDEEVDNITVFKGNSLYKTMAWKESHRDAFLQILISSYKNLQRKEHKLKIPAVVAPALPAKPFQFPPPVYKLLAILLTAPAAAPAQKPPPCTPLTIP